MKRSSQWGWVFGLLVSLCVGVWLGQQDVIRKTLTSATEKEAYLIAGWKVIHPDQMKPFAEAVVPLAKQAGFEMLAAGQPQLLEGDWPYSGVVIVQKYRSKEALLNFWRSDAHKEAIRLREGHVQSHFVIGVAGSD